MIADPQNGAGDPTVAPFLDAVVDQLRRHRAAAPSDVAAVPALRAEVLQLLASADEDAGARRLLADPPLLAAFFQNTDLLHATGAGHANYVSSMVMRALELLHEPAT